MFFVPAALKLPFLLYSNGGKLNESLLEKLGNNSEMLHFIKMKVFSITEIIWKGKKCSGFYPIKISVFHFLLCCFV